MRSEPRYARTASCTSTHRDHSDCACVGALEVAPIAARSTTGFGAPSSAGCLQIGAIGWIATICVGTSAKGARDRLPVTGEPQLRHAKRTVPRIRIRAVRKHYTHSQILQFLYGYRATDAGLVLGPGALVISSLAPIRGATAPRDRLCPPRVADLSSSLSVPQCGITAPSLWRPITHTTLGESMSRAGIAFLLRARQRARLFAVEADRTIGLPVSQIFPELGGSFGIAFITTAAARRHQFHQTNLARPSARPRNS